MRSRLTAAAAVLGALVGLGLALAGFFVGEALKEARSAERFVTVRGFAEKNVEADLVIWPITFRDTGNDLSELQKQVDFHKSEIRAFLAAAGFRPEEISEMPPQVTDLKAQAYGDGQKREYRYIATATITLRTPDIKAAKKAMEDSGKLVLRGIVLAEQDYARSTEFLFTGLNDIKPAMIAEATRNAREAAEQFARDSGARVGSIRRASQGLFTIEDRDKGSPDHKKVRVVTTVEYFLSSD
ncbi:MAG: SIMPL domain-containing protein [Synergistaceae bacterium]|jgi:hypothetical protein|nr:SIMPL domain-containing protein [Synergistaceae bacterium]